MEEILKEILKEQKEIKKMLQTIISSKEQLKKPVNIEDVKWNLIERAEKALGKELENNNAMSSERVTALTRLIEVLIRK